jgi:hypothetical protein
MGRCCVNGSKCGAGSEDSSGLVGKPFVSIFALRLWDSGVSAKRTEARGRERVFEPGEDSSEFRTGVCSRGCLLLLMD